MSQPLSISRAAWVIVTSTAGVVVVSGVAMWALDHSEYPNVGRGIWWALQTITTVGYGDVTPTHVSGRIVAALVMLWAIAFVAVLVAAITSTFISSVQQRQAAKDAAEEENKRLRRQAQWQMKKKDDGIELRRGDVVILAKDVICAADTAGK